MKKLSLDTKPLIVGSLVWLAVLLPVLCSAVAASGKIPEGNDGHGLFVSLELPWTVLMSGERIQHRFIVENASQEPMPVAIPVENWGFGWLQGGQPYLLGLPDNVPKRDILHVSKASWPPRTRFDKEMQGWRKLLPGERLVLNQNRLRMVAFGVIARHELKMIQALWLAGPEKWISSKLVRVKVVKVPLKLRKKVFETNWSSYGYGKDSCSEIAYTVPLQDRYFLFFGKTRLTEVQPGDEFEHAVDKHGTNLEITIRNSQGSRKVYYHLRHGLVGDQPWPIGPVKLFYPKPEPIPPARLAFLRKAMAEGSKPRRPRGKPQPATPPGDPQEEETDNTFRAWLAAALVLVLAALLYLAKKRRNAQ